MCACSGAARRSRWLPALRVAACCGALLIAAALLPASLGLPAFIALLLPLFFCVGTHPLINPNVTALGMAPFGDRAGTASALIGSLSFFVAGIVSAVVGAFHTDSALPMALTIFTVQLLAMFCFFVIARRAPVVPGAPAPAGH